MRIGIDIGGTKAAVALIDENGNILAQKTISTVGITDSDPVARDTAEAAKTLLEQQGMTLDDVRFVGIGVPGTVDRENGVVINAPNMHWKDQPLAAQFEKYTGKYPLLAQDTRAAAWCEARVRKEKKCVVCVTLGTGIGCGIVINGKIWHGGMGTAGEIGHIPVVPGGRACACGRKGCMEAYASGTGIARTAKERGIAESSEEVFRLAENQDERALALLEEAVQYAAMGISALINAISPDALIFSGGLSRQQKLYVEPLMEKIRNMAYVQAVGDDFYMGVSEFGSHAPILGAAFLDEAEGDK